MEPIKTVLPAEDLPPNQPSAVGLESNVASAQPSSRAHRDPLFPHDTSEEMAPLPSPKAKRSIANWAMLLVMLAAVAVIVSIAMNQRTVPNRTPTGAPEDPLPNTPTDTKPR